MRKLSLEDFLDEPVLLPEAEAERVENTEAEAAVSYTDVLTASDFYDVVETDASSLESILLCIENNIQTQNPNFNAFAIFSMESILENYGVDLLTVSPSFENHNNDIGLGLEGAKDALNKFGVMIANMLKKIWFYVKKFLFDIRTISFNQIKRADKIIERSKKRTELEIENKVNKKIKLYSGKDIAVSGIIPKYNDIIGKLDELIKISDGFNTLIPKLAEHYTTNLQRAVDIFYKNRGTILEQGFLSPDNLGADDYEFMVDVIEGKAFIDSKTILREVMGDKFQYNFGFGGYKVTAIWGDKKLAAKNVTVPIGADDKPGEGKFKHVVVEGVIKFKVDRSINTVNHSENQNNWEASLLKTDQIAALAEKAKRGFQSLASNKATQKENNIEKQILDIEVKTSKNVFNDVLKGKATNPLDNTVSLIQIKQLTRTQANAAKEVLRFNATVRKIEFDIFKAMLDYCAQSLSYYFRPDEEEAKTNSTPSTNNDFKPAGLLANQRGK